jgi:hypothetical protein
MGEEDAEWCGCPGWQSPRDGKVKVLKEKNFVWSSTANFKLLSRKKLNSIHFSCIIHNFDWLRAGRSGDRIPVGARFFAHVQTGPGAHLAAYTMDTGSFPGVNGRGVVLTTHDLLASRSTKSRAIPLPPSGPSGLLLGTFTFIIHSLYKGRPL